MMIAGEFTSTTTHTNYYTGFIYSVRIWTKDVDAAAEDRQTTGCTGTSTCSVCPASTGTCLSECSID